MVSAGLSFSVTDPIDMANISTDQTTEITLPLSSYVLSIPITTSTTLAPASHSIPFLNSLAPASHSAPYSTTSYAPIYRAFSSHPPTLSELPTSIPFNLQLPSYPLSQPFFPSPSPSMLSPPNPPYHPSPVTQLNHAHYFISIKLTNTNHRTGKLIMI
ncbi:hypothetical protein LIER_38610 [Lithospermum erythrorhizon]|uniref:Uncharacterized protein n=1 Tax=Lithospermum erythrorhizon TaxID=34254 RepID=A0AAV3Q2I0_LITER